MRRMGIEALYRRPRTTKPEPGHKIYPYLLRGIEIALLLVSRGLKLFLSAERSSSLAASGWRGRWIE
jgi:putative transposase